MADEPAGGAGETWGKIPVRACRELLAMLRWWKSGGRHGANTDAAGERPGGVFIARFLVKEVLDDYLRCRTWDGTTEGTEDVKVAKPPELRRGKYHGITIAYTQLGGSFSLTYSYTNAFTRTVTKSAGGTGSETQVIVPAYLGTPVGNYTGEEIYAAVGIGNGTGVVLNPGTGNEERLTWLDLNVGGRMWAKQ